MDPTQIKGYLPSELAQLTEMIDFTISDAKVGGSIDNQFSGMSKLTSLRLDENNFIGPFPDSLGTHNTLLRELIMNGNELDGQIGQTLSRLTNLKNLQIRRNLLAGEIPTAISNLNLLGKIRNIVTIYCDHLFIGSVFSNFLFLLHLRINGPKKQ